MTIGLPSERERTMYFNHHAASKFNDCLNGKCYCDRSCPWVGCMLNDECQNKAQEVSRLDSFTPACECCNRKVGQKFTKFASMRF